MSFHEVRFPTNISYGSKGGPGFKTSIIETDAGAEQRIPRYSAPRHYYDVSWAIKSQQDLADLKTFYLARLGCANGFRFKDWTDYNTSEIGDGAISFNDQICTRLTDTTFQLVKNYTSGSVTLVRSIYKPVAGTVVIGIDGENQGSGWSVNTTTGLVTFDSAVGGDSQVTWGGEFDVPVAFGKDIDESIGFSVVDFGVRSVDSIPIIEMMFPDTAIDEFFYGGAQDICLSADYTVSLTEGRFYVFGTPAAGHSVFLPDITDTPPGGPVFYFVNIGTNSMVVKKSDGTTLVTLASGQGTTILIGIDNAGTSIWYAI